MGLKRYFLQIVVALLVVMAAACQPATPTATPTSTPAPPIVVGISLPLTDRFSEPGTAAEHGYQVWAAMVNESGGLLGRQVELQILDNASDPDTAVSQYEQLITVDKVDLVFGPFSSLLVIPTSAKASELGYAFVEPAGGAADVFSRGLDNVFFAQPAPGARQADPFALYLLGLPADQRPKTFAVVTLDDPFTQSVADRLTGLLTDGGLEKVYDEVYPADTTDFSDIASALADLNPDLIVGAAQAEDSIAQIQAYRAAGYQPRLAYFTNGPSIPGPFKAALGSATEGIFSSISWFADAPGYQNADFVAKYVEMFGGDIADIAEDSANAFTVGQVVQQAAEQIKSIDNAALITELHQGHFNTVVGDLSFDATGAPQGSFMLLQWQGDSFVIVGPTDRAETDPLAPPKPEW